MPPHIVVSNLPKGNLKCQQWKVCDFHAAERRLNGRSEQNKNFGKNVVTADIVVSKGIFVR